MVWTSDLPVLEVKMWQSSLDTQLNCLTKIKNLLLSILYKHYLPKFSKLKKPTAEVKIWNSINYSTICCQMHSGTMAIWFCKALAKNFLMYLEAMFLKPNFSFTKGGRYFLSLKCIFFLPLGKKSKKNGNTIRACLLACLFACFPSK
jgi:hypothetical protein